MEGIQEHAARRLKESKELNQYLKSLLSALEQSLKLQSHYAKLLNMHDGGKRIAFESVDQWMERPKEVEK